MTEVNKKIVHTVFQQIAEEFRDRTAVQHGKREISYGGLSRLSDDIAVLLKQAGVGRGVIVGITLASSIEYVAAIIGVMKAGGLFLPLDMSLPQKRLAYILGKTAPAVVIGAPDFAAVGDRLEAAGFDHTACPVLFVGPEHKAALRQGRSLPPRTPENGVALPDPDDGCYIMYTSGSTGNPKAIEGCYKSLSHFVHWEVKAFGLDEKVRVTQLPPVTFDASLRDIFVPLICGGRLCIPEAETRTNMKTLLRWLDSAGITLMHCVPSLFRLLTREIEDDPGGSQLLPCLQYVLMAGEPLYGKDVTRWMDLMGERVALVNLYGPSETTLVKTFQRISQRPANPSAMIPVGQPIANTAILIIKGKRLCEPGEIGDIYIKTPFRTKGYYRDPALTQKSFVPNPLTGDAQDIVYKTGDMGRYMADRGVEFIGRLDNQVKVNGIRIELAEIESALLGNAAIDQAVVIGHRSRDNENTLVCYYTEKKATDAGEIGAWLRQVLPAYMVPSFFVRLAAFPLNINGKVDRKALPKPEELIYAETAYEPPADETEEVLAAIWSEILHLPKVGVNSPFFQIGGHSLTATRVLSRIYRELGVEISLKDFFANPTVRGLAGLLRQAAQGAFERIPVLQQQPDYAVSPSQRRLWVLDRLEEEGTPAYNLPGLLLLEDDIDSTLLRRAFDALIERHESLRTTFRAAESGPRQQVHAAGTAPHSFAVEEIDLSGDEDGEQAALQYAREQAAVPFDLAAGPLFRVAVLTLAGGRQALFFNMHHIIADAWSLDILARDLWAVYGALRAGRPNPLAPLRLQYRDYADWLNARLAAPEARKMALYWHGKLFGAESAALDLPLDFPRPRLQTYRGQYWRGSLDEQLTGGLTALSQQHDASLFMVLQALLKVMLHRYTGQQDIIVGSPVACRNHPDLEEQIGFFANTLALRDQIDPADTFGAVLAKVKQTTIDAYDHQLYPFDRLVGELDLARDPGRAPLFDVMLVYRDEQNPAAAPEDAPRLTALEVEAGSSRFDLTFEVVRAADRMQLAINYNSDLFREATIARMAGHLRTLAQAVLTQRSKAIRRLEMLDAAQKRLLVEAFNDTRAPYPEDQTLVDLFEAQAAQRPDHVAVVLPQGQLSYGEVQARARALADLLVQQYQVRPQEIVGLMVERSAWSVIGLLGILMAGAAYLPLDAAYPRSRIDYMLQDSGCRVLLSDARTIEASGPLPAAVTPIDLASLAAAGAAPAAPASPAQRPSAHSLAYVIYTSGSTGRPKGVMIEHAGFVNMALHQIAAFGVTPRARVLQFASASFDAALSEIFMALLAGAAVVVVQLPTIHDAAAFTDYLAEKEVTHATLPPVYLNALDQERLTTLTTLITAGEAPNTEDAVRLSRRLHYFNAYGPTEISVCATIERVTPQGDYRRNIPIGRPIANTDIHILDEALQPVPLGVAGEICIGGAGLARGYLNRPDLTAAKFVAHPFQAEARLYRTGDVGRRRADGTLEWLGRNDDQVKIRGHRIELGEVKNTLLRHAAVQDAVVIAHGRPADELAAYFSARERLSADELRSHLGAVLPPYMVPHCFIQLDALPLTANGKVDRKALPDPRAQRPQAGRAAQARSELEAWLLGLWRDVLENEQIGIHDNFFDAGGNSLRALKLISQIATGSDTFQFGKIPVKLLFLHPTVAALALVIDKPRRSPEAPAQAAAGADLPLPQGLTLSAEPLLDLLDAGRIAPVDAAAIICLPDSLVERTQLTKQRIIHDFCGGRPVLSSISDTFMGRVASIVLPCFASEIFSHKAALQQQVSEALQLAGRIGADTVALTGNLPPATDFGLDLDPAVTAAQQVPLITTGQATVAAAMGMTIEKMLQLAGRPLDQETIGLVGVNTIGAAALFLMLACMPHPRRIILADAYNNLLLAALLRQELADCGFEGPVEIMRAADVLPVEFYDASLLLGATNVPQIIEVGRARPGAILVEESGQHCFALADARRRLEREGDILFSEGDLLRLPSAAACHMYLPEAVADALRRARAMSLLAFEPRGITGCVLSGLLTHACADLAPTIGDVDGATCLRHYHHLHRLRFSVAAPHCGGYAIPREAIRGFRQRFGGKGAAARDGALQLQKGEALA